MPLVCGFYLGLLYQTEKKGLFFFSLVSIQESNKSRFKFNFQIGHFYKKPHSECSVLQLDGELGGFQTRGSHRGQRPGQGAGRQQQANTIIQKHHRIILTFLESGGGDSVPKGRVLLAEEERP